MNLGSSQYLFTVVVNPSEMPCLCFRYDVDAIVLQPHPEQPENTWEHIATFNALGMSLNNKHLTICSDVIFFFPFKTLNCALVFSRRSIERGGKIPHKADFGYNKTHLAIFWFAFCFVPYICLQIQVNLDKHSGALIPPITPQM